MATVTSFAKQHQREREDDGRLQVRPIRRPHVGAETFQDAQLLGRRPEAAGPAGERAAAFGSVEALHAAGLAPGAGLVDACRNGVRPSGPSGSDTWHPPVILKVEPRPPSRGETVWELAGELIAEVPDRRPFHWSPPLRQSSRRVETVLRRSARATDCTGAQREFMGRESVSDPEGLTPAEGRHHLAAEQLDGAHRLLERDVAEGDVADEVVRSRRFHLLGDVAPGALRSAGERPAGGQERPDLLRQRRQREGVARAEPTAAPCAGASGGTRARRWRARPPRSRPARCGG